MGYISIHVQYVNGMYICIWAGLIHIHPSYVIGYVSIRITTELWDICLFTCSWDIYGINVYSYPICKWDTYVYMGYIWVTYPYIYIPIHINPIYIMGYISIHITTKSWDICLFTYIWDIYGMYIYSYPMHMWDIYIFVGYIWDIHQYKYFPSEIWDIYLFI